MRGFKKCIYEYINYSFIHKHYRKKSVEIAEQRPTNFKDCRSYFMN